MIQPRHQLGCGLAQGPAGTFIQTDATRETTVPGLFACGDLAGAFASVALAIADGARAGFAAHQSLIFGDRSRRGRVYTERQRSTSSISVGRS